jgi:hypothetical protein
VCRQRLPCSAIAPFIYIIRPLGWPNQEFAFRVRLFEAKVAEQPGPVGEDLPT